MNTYEKSFTTGLPGLDAALKGVLAGDNIVWQVDTIEDYQALVTPFVHAGIASGRQVVYFRFATHPPIIPPDDLVAMIEGCRRGLVEFQGRGPRLTCPACSPGPWWSLSCPSQQGRPGRHLQARSAEQALGPTAARETGRMMVGVETWQRRHH